MFKAKSPFSRSLKLLIVLSLIFPPGFSVGQTRNQTPSLANFDYSKVMAGDPVWDQFVSSKWSAPKMGPLKADDLTLDSNPFFLAEQKWTSANQNLTGDTLVHKNFWGVDLQIDKARRSLKIEAPIKPLFETEEFLFFQATSKDVFEDRAESEDSYGEGLFFIDKSLLLIESFRPVDARPVPVFFLPFSGQGWTTDVTGTGVSDLDLVAFQNSLGETQSYEIEDIRQLAKIQKLNLTLATIQALKGDIAAIRKTAKDQILPFRALPRGSTAVFGLFYTGIDLDNPEKSLQKIALEKSWFEHLIPKAYGSDLLSPDVIDRLLIVGQITGTVFVTSILAKYTILKDRMLERRNFIESNEDQLRSEKNLTPIDRSTKIYKTKRELKEWVDVFSHGLATIATGFGTVGSYLLEYGADHLWRPDSKVNKLARKFLEKTFLYWRNQNENIGANAQTFMLGVVILGGIDTAGVVLQLLYVSPIFFPWVAEHFSPDMHARVSQEFSGQHEVNNNMVTSEIMRNLAAYVVSGAYSYSSQQRQKIIEDLRPKIEAQMMQEGRNPYDPQNHRLLNARLEKQIEKLLVERGLPSNKEFLFSGPSIFRALAHQMGYQVDRKSLVTDDHFVLEHARWGLISHALKRSIKVAKDLHAAHGDANTKDAAELLEELLKKYSLAKRMLTRPFSPAQNIREGVEARKFLTLLSYEGELIDSVVKFTDLWPSAKNNPKAAQLAGQIFRQGFFGLIQNKPYMLQPDTVSLEKHLAVAEQEAAQRIDSEIDPSLQTDADKKILALEIVKEKIESDNHKEAVKNWQPPKMDLLEKRQAQKADQFALSEVARYQMGWTDPDSEIQKREAIRIYRESYRKKLSELVGLHTYPQSTSDLVGMARQSAEQEVELALQQNEGLALFYNQLTDGQKLKFAGHMYAKAFLAKYTEMTVSNSSVVSLVAPEQPGRFQKLRQTKLVSSNTRLGRFLNKTLRALESPFDNGAYQPGLRSWLKRSVPFYGDTEATALIKVRTVFVAMSASWLSNYYLWQVHIPWDTYLFFFAAGGFTAVVGYWLDRIMINMGIRPMDTTWEKVKYSVLYTWLTYPTYIPFFFFREDWQKLMTGIGNVVQSCSKLLGGG